MNFFFLVKMSRENIFKSDPIFDQIIVGISIFSCMHRNEYVELIIFIRGRIEEDDLGLNHLSQLENFDERSSA